MGKSKSTEQVTEVRKLLTEGKPAKAARGFLVFTYGIDGKEATAILSEAGYVAGRSGNVVKDFYALLETGPMSIEAFEEWIGKGSKNVKAHRGHYNAIRELANSIHEK